MESKCRSDYYYLDINIKNIMKIAIRITLSVLLMQILSCKKFVDILTPPVTQLVNNSVYSSNSTAAAAITEDLSGYGIKFNWRRICWTLSIFRFICR